MKIVNNYTQNKIVNSKSNNAGIKEGTNSFDDILRSRLEKNDRIQFSKHASQRVNTRDINLSNEQMTRVEKGISLAKEKGIKDTLVMVDNVLLVVNLKSNVVVTAMNNNNKNIFTNIDGAVIV